MNALAKAFEGEPKTEFGVEDGQTVITVSMRHLRPAEAKEADWESTLAALACVGVSFWIGYEAMAVTEGAVTLFMAGLLGRPVARWQMREWSRGTAIVKFTPDYIWFRKPKLVDFSGEWQWFDRRHPHRFVLIQHEKARAENDEIEHQVRNSPGRRVTRYYSDTWCVVLEYLGQRFDLAEVMGERQATAMLDRLSLCDEYIAGLDSPQERLPMSPQDEWPGSNGAVP
ncbi:hypothetical protein Xaut_0532 [Xanthobacter versatilis]|uniref:Uncharacterized protein n=1 Tax=Xanthobacter autotrophicus (strain ATCC BAA-1158 / Py2) TaxID=78245 RepID=A7ICP5_XANP2|nr:hypothetical protein Xaut_0532 [Xanthobacter autotrophicus Py2]